MNPFVFDDYMQGDHWLPIFSWTHEEVFAIHAKYGIEPNPLYKKGCGRVGCFPCIHAQKDEIRAIVQHTPSRVAEVVASEENVARASKNGIASFFSADKCAGEGEHANVAFAHFESVADWAQNKPGSIGDDALFSDEDLDDGINLEAPTCESRYGLCGA